MPGLCELVSHPSHLVASVVFQACASRCIVSDAWCVFSILSIASHIPPPAHGSSFSRNARPAHKAGDIAH
ncbi:hypothetical protein, partial [Enterobacter ludwigii]|uniref:hypothetical protein n=1 Tax=Enterobacter ludwigii TaxID=299767 RepID=UPI001E408A34